MIRVLLWLYPPAWRARYGDELATLVGATGLGPGVVFDLIRSAGAEWRRSAGVAMSGGGTMMLGPAWRHPNVWAVAGLVVLAPTMLFSVGSLLAYQLGVGSLRGAMDAANAWLMAQPRITDLLLVIAPAAALLAAVTPLVHVELRPHATGREAVLALRLRALNLLIGFLALAVGALLVWHIVAESVSHAGT